MPVPFGILQRYVLGEVLRAFVLALLTITSVFVLFMVMAEASRSGLTPRDIVRLVPFILPVSLPYTVPVALLFSVTVVYGRLAADNEVIAVKTAGLSALSILSPAFLLGAALSGLLWYAGREAIPRANNFAQKILFSNMEDMFYKVLKKQREWNNHQWPFYIRVRDVQGKTMIDPIFKHRPHGKAQPNSFGMQVQAKTATIHFDLDQAMVHVDLEDAEMTGAGDDAPWVLVDGRRLDIPIANPGQFKNKEKRIQEKTVSELAADQVRLRKLIATERKRQALSAALWIGTGRIGRVDWPHLRDAFSDYQRWEREYDERETEKHMRTALACGCFFFVLLGAPVGILFARRDFLSAFISCFLPIIVVYYPLTLLGVNLGKEGQLNPMIALWLGNLTLSCAAQRILYSVVRH